MGEFSIARPSELGALRKSDGATTRSDVAKPLSAGERAKVKVDRHTLLLRGAPVAVLFSTAAAIITLAVTWGRIDHIVVGGWFAMSLTLSVIRLIVWARVRRRVKSSRALVAFTRFHVAAMALNGTLWGALAPVFAVSGMLSHAYFPFVMAVVTATSIASAGASWKAVLAFNTPILMSVAASYALFLETGGYAIAGIVLLYGLASAFLAWHTERMITRSIRLRSRNDKAFEDLTRKLDQTRDSEARFRNLVEAKTELTIIFSTDGRVVYVSPSAKDVLGASAQSYIGRTTRDVVHPSDLALFRELGGKSLGKLQETVVVPKICLIGADGKCRNLTGKLTNMLYVPGVEGFVFSGVLAHEEPCRTHATTAV